jgi:hypothetical protein
MLTNRPKCMYIAQPVLGKNYTYVLLRKNVAQKIGLLLYLSKGLPNVSKSPIGWNLPNLVTLIFQQTVELKSFQRKISNSVVVQFHRTTQSIMLAAFFFKILSALVLWHDLTFLVTKSIPGQSQFLWIVPTVFYRGQMLWFFKYFRRKILRKYCRFFVKLLQKVWS